jgi:serine/threonine protein kinase
MCCHAIPTLHVRSGLSRMHKLPYNPIPEGDEAVDHETSCLRHATAQLSSLSVGRSLPRTTHTQTMDDANIEQQLGDCLGKGAFGSVYRALNWSTGETVAIKQVRLTDLPKSELNVIMQEIDLLKNLHHANIVKYQGFVKTAESLYIILEYCENGSLHSICKNFGKFPENLVSLYTAQVLQGLLFLHEQGVIHRDIKGANILTTKEGLVKLADFGVATKQGLSEGSVVGTPYWMAPEVIELAGATTASDIWSLGCTVIELLDGKPPYHKLAPMPALFRIVNDDHPPLPEGTSPLVRDFLMQCFQKDPNLRVTAKKLLKHPWIMSSRREEKVNKPTGYDQVVRSVQEWNEALKSSPPNTQGPSRRGSARPVSRSPVPPISHEPPSKQQYEPAGNANGGLQIGQRKAPPAQLYQSAEEEKDIWDDDFESAISSKALQLPHLKAQDAFSGQFSAERLKQYATADLHAETDGKVEDWDGEFEGDLTVRSSLQLTKGDALETVRPFYPARATSTEIRHNPPPASFAQVSPRRRPSKDQQERKTSKDSQPRTQILRPAPQPSVPARERPSSKPLPKKPTSHGPTVYKESEEEDDYSDLVPFDDLAFQKKLASFSPAKSPHAADIRSLQTKRGGSMRRSSPRMVHDAAAMKRTRSSLEIQKYAEVEEDEDFTDLHFGDNSESTVLASSAGRGKGANKKTSSSSLPSEPSGSERGTLKLGSSSSWLGDEEDEDDPFAALEEELDEVDLESNVARDKHARLCTLVEGLVSDLKVSQSEDVLAEIVDQLLHILFESPDTKTVVVASHGMLPILEILDTCFRPPTILRLLKIVNIIISNNVEVQENLCFVGGIPIVSKFALKKYSSDIRLEAASFVRFMYQTSTLTLQMFVSCGGLNVLVEFLEEDYDTDTGRELVLVGVNGVWSVFELQGPTPKNDFCRIFSRSSVLYPLSLVLSRVLEEEGELAELVEGRIVNIFLLFSQAENHVKETIADRMVLKRVLKDLRRMSPAHQVTMLKFIKNLSMLATTLDALQNSNAIEVLTDLLNASLKASHFRDVSNQVLNTMFNLCRLSKARQEDAALSGVIPLLQRIVKTDRPLKEFALPILCDMAHSGKVGRKLLWQNKGLQFYIGLLADQYWAVTALDAIFIWLQEETAKVEEQLLTSPALAEAILKCFSESKADAFENLLEPLQKLLRLSPPVAASLAHRDLFARTVLRLHSKKALVRLNLLRIIRSICDASEEQGALIRSYNLLDSVAELAAHDPAILVREMANELVKSSEYNVVRRTLEVRPVRRSSSSTMTPPPSTSGSLPPTPGTGADRGASRGYFDYAQLEAARSASRNLGASSPYHRPRSRESSSAAPSSNWGSGGGSSSNLSSAAKSRLPRTSVAAAANVRRAQSRLSLAPLSLSTSETAGRKGEETTPTHAPAASRAVANARRRRQTSGVEGVGR